MRILTPWIFLIVIIYTDYQYYYNQAQQMIQEYKTALATWNEYMSSFKICQPCRAYNLLWNQNREKGDKHYERRTERNNDRMLGNNNNNNNNDGDGSEQARYNCYDAAGYTNVNQCYKFETKTSMAIAEPDDLARASEQGSILLIKAYGTVYGEGGYMSQSELDVQAIYNISLAVLAICSFALCIGCIARYCRARRNTMEGKSSSSSLSETFYEEDSDFDDKEHVDTTTKRSSAGTRSWWNRSSRKKRRILGIDIGTVHKHADIESGSYTPPSRQETPSNSSDWLKITSVSTNSFEIEMKKFNNETEKVRMSKSNLLQTPLRTFVSEVDIMNATSHAESTASVIAVDGNTISSTSPPAAASDVLVSPPPPESLASIHDSSINAALDVAAPPSLHESLVSDHDISIREHTEDDTTSPDISIQKHAEAAPNMAAPPPLPETLVSDHDGSIQKHAEVDTTTTDAAVSDVAAPLPLPESLELDHDRSSFLEHANEVTTSPDAASNVAAPPPLPESLVSDKEISIREHANEVTSSPDATFDVAAPPPLLESLVSDHDSNSRERTDDDAQLGAIMERSNYIGFESEMLDSSDNDNNLISSCIGYDDSSHLRTNDDILAATSRNNETRVFDHVGNIGAFEHDSSTEGSVSLNDSSTLPIEVVAADNSSSLAGPALLLVLLMKQEAAAVLIQAQWRRYVASKSFLRKRNAAVACQCKIRKWSARRRVTQMRSHLTMTIQRSESQPEAQTQRNRDATRVKCIPNRSRRFNYTKY